MKLRDKIRQVQRPADFWLLLHIAGLALIMPILLRWLKFPTLLRLLRGKGTDNSTRSSVACLRSPVPQHQIDKIVLFTGFLLGHGFGGKKTCLKRSLILYHFLRKAGVDVEIDLGIAKEDTELVGHSWLTLNGAPFLENDAAIKTYEPMLSSKVLK